MYFWLGDALEMGGSYQEADTALNKALDLNRIKPDDGEKANIVRDLIASASALNRTNVVDGWFNILVQTGFATSSDWEAQARRLDSMNRYAEAGVDWQRAAEIDKAPWTDWCEAAGSYAEAPEKSDETLYTARKCISDGSGESKSEGRLSLAHFFIASILNDRGVFEEALSQARESIVLNGENGSAYDAQAVALIGLRRNQEAVNASKQAIRLTDGKYGIMHFHLGSAYFGTENWQAAAQSFEKAAELMPISDAAAYNVALCLAKQGITLDAAHWYEECLRRNPNRSDKQDILSIISALRQR
jgi:tetratricopeptide (TPR) repeat protein